MIMNQRYDNDLFPTATTITKKILAKILRDENEHENHENMFHMLWPHTKKILNIKAEYTWPIILKCLPVRKSKSFENIRESQTIKWF